MWWINGREDHGISVGSRGLAYGDGLFETMRCLAGEIPLLERHIARLHRGAGILGLNIHQDVLDAQLKQVMQWLSSQTITDAAVKLMVVRRGEANGYTVGTQREVDCLLRATPVSCPNSGEKLSAHLCTAQLSTNPLLAGIKHLNRLDQVLASQQLSGEDEGILFDSEAHVAEGITNNLFVVKGSDIITPFLRHCGVWGVMREYLLSEGATHTGYTFAAQDISIETLLSADEILLTNALRGVRNLNRIDDRWQSGGSAVGDSLRAMLRTQLHPDFISY